MSILLTKYLSFKKATLVATVTFAMIVLSFAAFSEKAKAHTDPGGCFATGVNLSLAIFRSDGTTPVGGDTVAPGETIKYQATLSHAGAPNCNYEGGNLAIITPDGVNHDVDGGTIPLINGTSFTGTVISYVVNAAHIGGDGDLDASAVYSGGTSHLGTSNVSPVGATTPAATVVSGNIITIKQTTPEGSLQMFDFNASWDAGEAPDFQLADNAQNNSGPLVPGAYDVSEVNLPSGWTLNSTNCVSSLEDPADTDGQALDLDAGETITCTFTNSQGGNIIVDKITDPSGDSTPFDFNPSWSESNFTLTDQGTPVNSGNLVPGTYSVAELAETGWDLTSATCDGQGNTPENITLGAGQTVTCTFNNQKDSKIIVDKVTVPADSAVQFDFTTSYGSPFMLTDDSTPNDSGDINPGEYDVTEGSESGWTNTSVSCVSSIGDSTDTDGQDLDLDAGEIITCTFTNTEQTGNIIVDKVTNPDNDPTEFDFNPSWSENNFSLTDNDTPENSGPLSVGSYSVVELAESGWDSDDGVCDSTDEADTSTPGNIDLDAGETITCTFTNTQDMGRIVVDKVVNPSGNSQSFNFNADGAGYDDFSLTGSSTPNDQELVAGTYSVSETLPANWEQTSATCVSSMEDDETIDNLELDAGETITCTFTNTMDVVQWCSPGYWKNHLDEAAEAATAGGFSLGDAYSAHFPALTLSKKAVKDSAPANPTLQQVLENPQWYGGPAANNVGDLLSEAHPDVDFDEGDSRVENCPLN